VYHGWLTLLPHWSNHRAQVWGLWAAHQSLRSSHEHRWLMMATRAVCSLPHNLTAPSLGLVCHWWDLQVLQTCTSCPCSAPPAWSPPYTLTPVMLYLRVQVCCGHLSPVHTVGSGFHSARSACSSTFQRLSTTCCPAEQAQQVQVPAECAGYLCWAVCCVIPDGQVASIRGTCLRQAHTPCSRQKQE
jgi:hypothetical protein